MKIGDNILRIRKEKGLRRMALLRTLRFIYGKAAIDYRTILRIETGQIVKGRLSSLLQIADALGVKIEELYKGTEFEDKAGTEESLEGISIMRAEATGGSFNYSKNASIEIASPEKSPYIMFLLRLGPGGQTKMEQDPEGTVKFLYVFAGEIKVSVGNIERTLRRGDSIQINSNKPHYFANTSKKKARGILYQNPKNF
jgi:quercetin dioxygenase-like cupin family protein